MRTLTSTYGYPYKRLPNIDSEDWNDIWSLGVLFYAMLFGVFPFKGKDEDELFEKIKEAKVSFPEYNPISDKTKELFGKIFKVIPSERISLDDMINYLKEEEWY